MTGHGVAYSQQKDRFVEIVVRALNGRFLEIRFQMSDFYSSMEGELRKKVQKKFTRGNIDILINRKPAQPGVKTKLKWNYKQALVWKAFYKKMAFALKLQNNLDLLSLSRQPGVLDIQSVTPSLSTQEKQIIKNLLQKAINLCDKEKSREGLALKKEFQKNLTTLSHCLQLIKRISNKQKREKKKQLKRNLSSDVSTQQQSANEAVVMLSRVDIEEELSRLVEHIRIFRTLITKKSIMGKQMNFYLQEMIREINTIGSKSQEVRLTREVVNAKTLIETMREQVQNVE